MLGVNLLIDANLSTLHQNYLKKGGQFFIYVSILFKG